MKALILVGGMGTRLRPLTSEIPKPLVSFCGRPMVEWQIEALTKVGVKEIVLAIGYKEEVMLDFVNKMEDKYKIKLHCSVEKTPLGTGGPLKLAEKFLRVTDPKADRRSKLFFVLNADIICEYPFEKMIEFHLQHDGWATILTKTVEEWSAFGILVHDGVTGKVSRFAEKPKEFVGNDINAGIYVMEPEVIDLIEDKPTMLERETFPLLAEKGKLYCTRLNGFWKDIGKPTDYLLASQILIDHFVKNNVSSIDDFELVKDEKGFKGPNLIHKSVKVHKGASVGPFCVMNEGVIIEEGATVEKSILFENVHLGWGTVLKDSILAESVKVGKECHVAEECVIGAKANISDGLTLKRLKSDNGSKL